MSSRYLIPVLCVGAVAFACGPRARNEASTPRKDSVAVAQSAGEAMSLATQQGAPLATVRSEKAAKPKVGAELYVRTNGAQITFAMRVVNNTKKSVELTFPTGQTHDFIVVDSLGREMWRWGTGRMFTQTLRNTLLGGGESLDVEGSLELRKALPPGRYTARGVLTSANYPLVQQAEFTIDATTIAQR
jgi:hypothetical protein